jgi:hypothetical protein
VLDFPSLTRKEAQAYLGKFLAEMPASASRLTATLDDVGADTYLAGSFAAASLDDLWRSVMPVLGWQDRYQPADPPTRLSPSSPIEGLGDLGDLPSWFTTSTGYGLERFSPRTLWVMDGVARHLGNVLVHTHGWEWRVGRGRKGYVFQNQPVIAGPTNEFSPLMSLSVLVGRHLKGDEQPGALRETYENWTDLPPVG